MDTTLIPKHGGYRNLKTFQISELIYDVTVRYCDKFVNRRSRTHDQMVQAARSGVQNIAEGSYASGTSKKMELKLTNVARASQEELRRDYEDQLRQHNLPKWERNDPRRCALIALRPHAADDVARWAVAVREGRYGKGESSGHNGHCGQSNSSTVSTVSTMSTEPPTYLEILANGALALLAVSIALLGRQVQSLARDFEQNGGFTERLFRTRKNLRNRT